MNDTRKPDGANGNSDKHSSPNISDGETEQNTELEELQNQVRRNLSIDYALYSSPFSRPLFDDEFLETFLSKSPYSEADLKKEYKKYVREKKAERQKRWSSSISATIKDRLINTKSEHIGVTYKEISGRTGISVTRLSNIATGSGADLRVWELFAIADDLNISPMSLIDETTYEEDLLLEMYRSMDRNAQKSFLTMMERGYNPVKDAWDELEEWLSDYKKNRKADQEQ